MKTKHAAQRIQDEWVFGEYGGVNPSICDSATFTFMHPETMSELFTHEIEGCFLYSRHWNPSNKALGDALAQLEGSEAALVTASGMAAISSVLLQLCRSGDEIVSSRTVYGGTYALMKYFLPRFGIKTRFVNIVDLAAVEEAITGRTRLIYTETLSNPLLELADIPGLSELAHDYELPLVVDNTFTPLIFTPLEMGADIVVHSLTKYINGSSDCVAGAVCATPQFVRSLIDVSTGAAMLLGPVLDSFRANSILKNLHTLHVRMRQHSANAHFLAQKLQDAGVRIHYPGLTTHPQHHRVRELMHPRYGFGGMMTLDAGDWDTASALMAGMQDAQIGYIAVSLGFHKTLFSAPGSSTSSEIPEAEQAVMGLGPGLIRFSIGLDQHIDITLARIMDCLDEVGLLGQTVPSRPVPEPAIA